MEILRFIVQTIYVKDDKIIELPPICSKTKISKDNMEIEKIMKYHKITFSDFCDFISKNRDYIIKEYETKKQIDFDNEMSKIFNDFLTRKKEND